MLVSTSTLGFPRMGPNRELKFALEKFWKGGINEAELIKVAESIEDQAWKLQVDAGIDRISVGDHYLYDAVLAWADWLGLIPKRFAAIPRGLMRMFAMARGVQDAPALSMKKWLTSNYHYMVPEVDGTTTLKPDFSFFLKSVQRGLQQLGKHRAAPVVLGPVTMAYLTKFATDEGSVESRRISLVEELIPIYHDLFTRLDALGVSEVQIHEAALVFDDSTLLPLYRKAYPALLSGIKASINLVSFMEDVGKENYKWMMSIEEFSVLSLDFTRGSTISLIREFGFPSAKTLGVGLIDCRSVWRVDPKLIKPIMLELAGLAEKIRIQPSGSLQYVPLDLNCESQLLHHPAGQILSFATQKLDEVVSLAKAFQSTDELAVTEEAWGNYRRSVSGKSEVVSRMAKLEEKDFCRAEPFEKRRPKQLPAVPLLPTTSIGSFPQTKIIRQLRSQRKKGILKEEEYNAAIDQQIAYAIGVQEALGLDILVHGEAERSDMVEFFAQRMEGMLFTANGWVQSFGSRCVRPPIIWSDISRTGPMTVREFKVAQGLTDKPVKGMLTGPVTILNWSFARADISRKDQCFQIALAIRDEIADLEEAGCKVIQVDEPALREAMPIRHAFKAEYLKWAVDAFRLATGGARSDTQVHTHMCYCEFDDCMEAIDDMDTDVNSIENARSDNATLKAFKRIGYKKNLGPGTYDIHSPVCPSVDSITEKLKSFLQCIEVNSLVVNPDCGLKTRTWPETISALQNMVAATKQVRAELGLAN